MGATKRAGFICIGYWIRKEGVTICGLRLRSKFKKQAAGLSWSPEYCPVRPSRSSPSSRRAQRQVTRGGTARGKKGEGPT